MSDFGDKKPTSFDDRITQQDLETKEQLEKSKNCHTCKWKDSYAGSSYCSLSGSSVNLNNCCKHWSK